MIGRSVFTLALLCGAAARAAPFTCPHTGGDLVFGQEANVNSARPAWRSNTISTRNIAMNIFEALHDAQTRTTRLHQRPRRLDGGESGDHMSYTFKLRGRVCTSTTARLMTSADVAASFERYKRHGVAAQQRSTTSIGWDTPDGRRPSSSDMKPACSRPSSSCMSSFSGADRHHPRGVQGRRSAMQLHT